MKIHKNTLLRIIYEPKKVLLSRTALSVILVSSFAIGAIFIKQHGLFKHKNEIASAEVDSLDVDYNNSIAAMQAHITSLNSRIKHLSLDNKRLSTRGHNLSEQLRSTSSSIKEQLVHTKELQLELYSLDQHLISKYDNFIEQQKLFSEAKSECDRDKEKGKNKEKSKKCLNFAQVRQNVEDLVSQIKFLKAKREVLLSEIDRTAV